MNPERNIKFKRFKAMYPVWLILGIGLIFLFIGFGTQNLTVKSDKSLFDSNTEVYDMVYVEIKDLPIQIEYADDNYYLFEDEPKSYIIKLNDRQYAKLYNTYQSDTEIFQYHVVGKCNSVFTNLEDAVISAYNKEKGEKILTHSNFSDNVYPLYIDGLTNNSLVLSGVCFMLSGIFLFISVLLFVMYINANLKFNKALKTYGKDRLEKVLNDAQTLYYGNCGIYLTEHELISIAADFKVIRYQDIYWTYLLKRRLNFVTIAKYIMVGTKDGKIIPVATAREEKQLAEIIEKIRDKTNNTIVGFTPQNKKNYYEMIRR